MKTSLLVGTYSPTGIFKLNFNDGILSYIDSDKSFENCSYIVKYNNFNYNIVEMSNNSEYSNGLLLFRNDDLSIKSTSNIEGSIPCYICPDFSRNLLYVANYGDGSLNVFYLDSKSFQPKLIYTKHFTEHSHIHCINLSSDNNFLFFTDLGDDKLYAYKILYSSNSFDLQLISSFDFDYNSQPRHLVINDNNIFLITENSCELFNFTFLPSSGFTLNNKCSILPCDVKNCKDYTGCAIKLSNDKKFLYLSVRGINQICVFEANNSLNLIQSISCYGQTPRELFLIDDYLLCANQSSNSISIFNIKKNTGELCFNNLFNIPHPAYIC